MSNHFVPIETAELDWLHELPFSKQYDSFYYSEDGLDQSHHVFVDGNHLIERWAALPNGVQSHFNIAEIGFGTGLNFLLTWSLWEQYAPSTSHLHFISCENHPIQLDDLLQCLSQWPQLEKYSKLLIAQYPVLTPGYHHLSFCNARVTLTLMLGDAFDCYEQLLLCGDSILEAELRTTFIDAWYLDGFSPKKNEMLWRESLVSVIAMLSGEGTTLSTCTATSSVNSSLAKYGFVVEEKKGFGSKQNMLTAQYSKLSMHRLKTRNTPWHVGDQIIHEPEKKAIIIGGGLAGCFTAYSLAVRGWKVTLIEELDAIGEGASANQQAVLFPKLSAYRSPLTQFMLSAFLYANRFYQTILDEFNLGELNGSLVLPHNEKERLAQCSLANWLHIYPELGQLVDAQQASELAGISLDQSGLYIPLSGWLNSPALCQRLSSIPGISILYNERVEKLIRNKNSWLVNDLEAQVVVLTNGYKVKSFEQTQHLPIKSIRGQMTSIPSSSTSSLLKIPLCGEGHVLPQIKGMHSVGATYNQGIDDAQINLLDDDINFAKLGQLAPNVSWTNQTVGHWAGVRASVPDYLPLVGQIPKSEEFLRQFSGLESNSKRWIPHAGPYHEGLYVCAAFGSRGLTTIPLCADWLAATLNNELTSLPRNQIQALSPARFLRRTIIQGTP